MRVFILDEVEVRPGQAEAFTKLYQEEYMPGARRRGMILDGAWQTPPVVTYEDYPTTLFYMWSVADVHAWWDMRKSRLPDGSDERQAKHGFWLEAEPLVLRRTRRFLSPLPEGG